MVHVFTLGNFSGELRRKDCLCGTGHFFLDFADLAQQVGPLLSRGIGSLAALSVEDDHIVLDPSLLLAERPNQRGDMNIIAIFPEQRVFPTIFPLNDPLSSHPFDLVDSRIEHTGIQFESHAVDHDYMFMPVYGDDVHADVLSFHIRPHPNLRRALLLGAVRPPIAKSCGIKNLDPPLKSRFSTACRAGSVFVGMSRAALFWDFPAAFS